MKTSPSVALRANKATLSSKHPSSEGEEGAMWHRGGRRLENALREMTPSWCEERTVSLGPVGKSEQARSGPCFSILPLPLAFRVPGIRVPGI